MLRKHADTLLYILQSLIGAGIGYAIYRHYPVTGAWCLISILLVLAPDRNDAMKLAVTRIKANILGAFIGLVLFYIHPVDLLMICIGIISAIVICELLKLQEATRSSVIAVLIIIMHEPGKYFWDVALERAGGVMLGCFIGVIITYLFHNIHLKFKPAAQDTTGSTE